MQKLNRKLLIFPGYFPSCINFPCCFFCRIKEIRYIPLFYFNIHQDETSVNLPASEYDIKAPVVFSSHTISL